MIRVQVSYPAVEGRSFDHAYYQSEHRALIQRLLGPYGLQRVEMDRGLPDKPGNRPAVAAAAHMLFDTLENFKAGMKAAGKALAEDMPRYTQIKPIMTISETQYSPHGFRELI